MTYTAVAFDDPFDSPISRTRLQVRLFASLVGLSAIAAAMVTTSDLGRMMRASPPVFTAPFQAPAPKIAPAPLPTPVVMRPLPAVRLSDIGNFPSAGALSGNTGWMFAPAATPAPETDMAAADEPAADDPAVEAALSPGELPDVVRMAPLPSSSPRIAAAPTVEDVLPPLPARNPLLRVERQVASLPPASRALEDERPSRGAEVALPGPGDRYALYDITAGKVYMPSGEKLEAHSGYGDMFDDPRHISKKMRGPTPPNTYNLTMREALFHGVEALRMNPVDGSKMYGRDGILAHTYMLGPRGDSNGCVSFRDYQRFLAAYKRGEVKQMIVVASLKEKAPASNLLSWLMPK